MKAQDITVFPTLVESPFIIARIGDYTFGNTSKTKTSDGYTVTFPNFMNLLTVTKINGQVNLYELSMTYAISAGDDPNMLDHVFSNIANQREMYISYGDYAYSSTIYKEEQVTITNVTSNMDFASSQIQYTISGIGAGIETISTKINFSKVKLKASTALLDMIFSAQYLIGKSFKGMSNKQKVLAAKLIPTDDIEVEVNANPNCSVFDRINQLVNSMRFSDGSIAGLAICDDIYNEMGGPYFKVYKIGKSVSLAYSDELYTTQNSYTIDVGFPQNVFVTSFKLLDNEQWSILYKTAEDSGVSTQLERINTFGQLEKTKSLGITRGNQLKTTQEDANWWDLVTSFPVKASLEVKGLVRPTLLMNYIKINSRFYGRKHISSGIYVITKQVDTISGGGYKTSLELLKIKGDE